VSDNAGTNGIVIAEEVRKMTIYLNCFAIFCFAQNAKIVPGIGMLCA